MGYSINQLEQLQKQRARGVERTHEALRFHPNFRFPDAPADDRAALVEFVLEAVARFVSPPKIASEDEEFACEDIANAIRTKLSPEIFRMLGLPKDG
jgi:hypothetical protein